MNKRQFLIWKKSRNNEPEIISSHSRPMRRFFNQLKTEIAAYRRQTKQKRLAGFWVLFWLGITFIIFPRIADLMHLKNSICIPLFILIGFCWIVAIAKYGKFDFHD